MNPQNFENLNNEFEIEPIETKEIVSIKTKTEIAPYQEQHLDTDYQEIRNNLKDIIKRGQEAIDGILVVASETQQPRAYEVVATLIKNVAEVNTNLLNMHKQIKDIKKESGNSQTAGQITNNAIFVGSTHELQSLLKGKMEQLNKLD